MFRSLFEDNRENHVYTLMDLIKENLSKLNINENLSEENLKLFEFYDQKEDFFDEEHRSPIICQSLRVMLAVLNYETVEDAIKFLTEPPVATSIDKPVQFSITVDSNQLETLRTNLTQLYKLRDEAIKKGSDPAIVKQKLIRACLLLKIGKNIRFSESQISKGEEFIQGNHESYLSKYLQKNPEDAATLASYQYWAQIFNSFGLNSQKLIEKDFIKSQMIVPEAIAYYKELLDANCENANIKALNRYFYNRVKLIPSLASRLDDFSFLNRDETTPYNQLPPPQKILLTLLIWCCAFAYIKHPFTPGGVMDEFLAQCEKPENEEILRSLAEATMENLSSENPILLYGLPDLLHREIGTKAHGNVILEGNSHFSRVAAMEHLFKWEPEKEKISKLREIAVRLLFDCLFPYLLELINNHQEDKEEITLRGPNQVFQGVEIFLKILEHVLKEDQFECRVIRFSEGKNDLFEYLEIKLNDAIAAETHVILQNQAAKADMIPEKRANNPTIFSSPPDAKTDATTSDTVTTPNESAQHDDVGNVSDDVDDDSSAGCLKRIFTCLLPR